MKDKREQIRQADDNPGRLKYSIQYFVFTFVLVAVSLLLLVFLRNLFIGWSDPEIDKTYDFISSRLGEIIALGISVVVLLYLVGSTFLLVYNVIKYRFREVNYLALVKIHKIVLSAFLVYAILFAIIFYRPI